MSDGAPEVQPQPGSEANPGIPGSEAGQQVPQTPPAGDTGGAAPPPAAPSWMDQVKDISVGDLLKAKGIENEKVVKLIDHAAKKGSIDDYFKAYSTDYNAVPETELLRMKVERDYADYTEQEKNALYNRALDQYRLDEDLYTPDQVEMGKVALKADMQSFRKQILQEQESMLFKDTQTSQASGMAEGVEQYRALIEGSEACKGLKEKGVLTVGSGEMAFNMDVNADTAMRYLTDQEFYTQTHLNEKGLPDPTKDLRIASYATDMEGFERKLIEHGMKLGRIALAKEIGHEDPGYQSAGSPEELSPEQKLALRMYGPARQ